MGTVAYLKVSQAALEAAANQPKSRAIGMQLLTAGPKGEITGKLKGFSPSSVAPKLLTMKVGKTTLTVRAKSSGSFNAADIQADNRNAVFEAIWSACAKNVGTPLSVAVTDIKDAAAVSQEVLALDLELGE